MNSADFIQIVFTHSIEQTVKSTLDQSNCSIKNGMEH